VAGTPAVRFPYLAALQLAAWAVARANYVEGRLLLEGIDANDLTFRQLLCVALALRVEGHPMADLDTILTAYDEALAENPMPDRATWGTSAEEWDAMMVANPPAPLRDPNKQRPVPRRDRDRGSVRQGEGGHEGVR